MKNIRYSAYKQSPLPWNKEIPAHWISRRGKFLFKVINQRSEAGAEELLSVTENYGVIPRKNANVTMFLAENYEGYKLCEKGDLVINSLWAWGCGLGFSEYNGIVSTAYSVYRLKKSNENNYRYFNYLLRTKGYVGEYLVRSKGIWISRLQLSDFSFLDIQLILPPLEEQNTIVNYLDKRCEIINRGIASKQKLIALLKEQKQSLICKIVTKGINENAELKDTGLDWLGKIPKHWETLPFFAAFKEKYIKNDKQQDYDVLSLSYGKIVKRKLDENFGLLPESFDTYQMVNPGDYIFRLTDMQNDHKSLRVALSKLNGIITSAYLNVRAKISIDEEFGFYLLHSYDLSKIIYTFGGGVRQAIGFSELKRLPILIPPEQEQKEIVNFIKIETGRIDDLISRIQKEIELVKEYKQSIIAEVVTGKIKVT